MKGELPEGWRWHDDDPSSAMLRGPHGEWVYAASGGHFVIDDQCDRTKPGLAIAPIEVVILALRAAGWTVTPPGGREP